MRLALIFFILWAHVGASLCCQLLCPFNCLKSCNSDKGTELNLPNFFSYEYQDHMYMYEYRNFYYGIIKIGTAKKCFLCKDKEQYFTVVLSTGSDDLWVPATHCSLFKNPTSKRNTYKSDYSSTYRKTKSSFELKSGETHMEGTYGFDTLFFAGISIPNQAFGLAYHVSNDFKSLPFDGVLGFNVPKEISSDDQLYTVTQNLRMMNYRSASIYLNKYGEDKSVLILNKADPSFSEPFVSFDVTRNDFCKEYYWQFGILGIGYTMTSGSFIPLTPEFETVYIILNIGNPCIFGPAKFINVLHYQMHAWFDKSVGYYRIPEKYLATLPTIHFRLDDTHEIRLTADYYTQEVRDCSETRYYSLFQPLDLPAASGQSVWVVGPPLVQDQLIKVDWSTNANGDDSSTGSVTLGNVTYYTTVTIE